MVLQNIQSINRIQKVVALNNTTIWTDWASSLGSHTHNHCSCQMFRFPLPECFSRWSKPELPREIFQVAYDVYLQVCVGTHLSLHTHKHLHNTCTDSPPWMRMFQQILLVKCSLFLHPFLMVDNRGAEIAGFVCSEPPASFCGRLRCNRNFSVSSAPPGWLFLQSLSSKGTALPQPPGIFRAPFFNNFCFPGWSLVIHMP